MKETASCTAEEKRSLGVWPWKPNQRETAEKLRFLGSGFGLSGAKRRKRTSQSGPGAQKIKRV
jgi:hypothetical protein